MNEDLNQIAMADDDIKLPPKARYLKSQLKNTSKEDMWLEAPIEEIMGKATDG